MKKLIKGGRVLNPASNFDEICDVLIKNDRVIKIAKDINEEGCEVLDATDKWVTPGFIDVHTHLREPGFEYKETLRTGSRSAAIGGFTTICAMPNTNPVADNEVVIGYIKMKAEQESLVNILPIGAITRGQEGLEMANIGLMAKAGACAISEDGKSVEDASLLKTAMQYASTFDMPVLCHCEDKRLTGGGQIHSGDVSNLLGLKGISRDSEDIITVRDIMLAISTGSRVHICHVSTKGSVETIRHFKSRYNRLTAEVCPHHFSLTHEAAKGYDTNAKMAPPLREQSDVDALIEGLKDGTIDIIATDHAPHHLDEKKCEFDRAAFGIVGLETALPLGITNLVQKGHLTPLQFIGKLTYNPSKMLNIDRGTIREGAVADITVVDPSIEYEIDVNTFRSKSKNSPFHGFKVTGKTYAVLVNGEYIVKDYDLLGDDEWLQMH